MENLSDKSILRKYAKSLRDSLPIKEYSSVIFEKLQNLTFYKEAKNILIYSSFSSETDTNSFMVAQTDKCFYLPKINGDELDIIKFEGFENCTKNYYGIFEPTGNPIKDLSVIDLSIIPALAADKKGFRLGYGKGFYDRFLPKLRMESKKIILIPDELIFNTIPHEKFDVRCDILISQRNIMFF